VPPVVCTDIARIGDVRPCLLAPAAMSS